MPARFARHQAISLLVLVALCAWAVARATHPPAPVPATAPDSVFSAERAMRHVAAIAQRPHALGMADHDRVRDYLLAQLSALGVTPQVQATTGIGTRYQAAGRVQNIVARLPGRASNGHAVLLMAHYDGVEAGPAASDDGAGSAALLETLRALRARRTPLARDVIVLFTDGEESGLLGAAAFVREHPWARDVAFALNVEARGTTGRSYMFETGPGNLDAVRALRAAPDVTAGSVFTTVYRTLPNDTDLSELSLLGVPALNFAYAAGVERYHTAHDDTLYLNPGSLQHHGSQLLAIAKAVGDEALPRPKTGDAVFFDLPALGLVIYPEWLAIPLALLALVGTIVVVAPMWRDALAGAVVMLASTAIVGLIARSINLTGHARWSGIYVAAIALCTVGVNILAYRLVRRWKSDAYTGALLVWLLLALATSFRAPGASYLFTWPLLFALIAARSQRLAARWTAAIVTILVLVGITVVAAEIMLGLAGAGSIALAVLTSLMAWLLAPLIEDATPPRRAAAVALYFAPAAVLVVIGVLVAKPSPAHPTPTGLTYAVDADADSAFLAAAPRPGSWTRAALGAVDPAPDWLRRVNPYLGQLVGRTVPRLALDAPSAAVVGDSTTAGVRRLTIRVLAPGTTKVLLRASGAPVLTASIDGRAVDTTRYRRRAAGWTMQYYAVPASGAMIGLAIPAGRSIDFDVSASRPGLPAIPGVAVAPRPPWVVPAQDGDVSVVVHHSRF